MTYAQYLIAASGITSSIVLSTMNTVLMGYLVKHGSPVISILLARQVICTTIICVFCLWKRSTVKTKYWKLHLVRSVAAPLAAFLWGKAIAQGVPLGICGFISLMISVSSMVIARFALNEKWPKAGWGLIISILPILYDLFCSNYKTGVFLLITTTLIYGLLDSVNVYIMKPKTPCFMQKIIRHKGQESILLINLYDNIASLVLYLVLFMSNPNTMHTQSRFIPYYLIMGAALAISMPLAWFSYSMKDISSMQFLRIAEPILSNAFGDRGPIPLHILVGTLLFGMSSLCEVALNLGLF